MMWLGAKSMTTINQKFTISSIFKGIVLFLWFRLYLGGALSRMEKSVQR